MGTTSIAPGSTVGRGSAQKRCGAAIAGLQAVRSTTARRPKRGSNYGAEGESPDACPANAIGATAAPSVQAGGFDKQVASELTRKRPRLTRTFDVPEVEADFVSFCQLTNHTPYSPAEAGPRRRALLRQVSQHACLPEFAVAEATQSICGSTLLQPLESEIGIDRWIDARSMFAALCATRLLTVAEERSVMRRMHYFKHLAWNILSAQTLTEWDWVRAEGLAKAAMWHRDLIVQANMRLVVSIVRKLPVDSNWHDELISDGTVALLRAADKFDPSRGYRFCTYATPAIRRECFLQIKQRRLASTQQTPTALPAVAAVGEGGEGDANVGSDRAHWLAWRDRLAGMMGVLTRREQVIIRSRYCLGAHRRVKTLQRLAVALKISKERVRQLEIGALAKLRAAAEL